MRDHLKKIQYQFGKRSSTFEESTHWITDKNLINAHMKAAGSEKGSALELCCGTAVIGRELKSLGWDIVGVDITDEMLAQANKFIATVKHNVEELPFPDESFDLVIMRQAYFLIERQEEVLKEVFRVLKPSGKFVISQTLPFSDKDTDHLKVIHETKQAQMTRFFTDLDLKYDLIKSNFEVVAQDNLVVRESISRWMDFAPELSANVQQKVKDLIVGSPDEYKQFHKVENNNGEILEDWNWVIFTAQKKKEIEEEEENE